MVACARHGSLGRAAAALDMTQPAMSRMLKRLEDSFGVALFERTTRGIVPTVYGEAVLPYAELVISEIAKAGAVVDQMRGAAQGVVRIGGVGSVVGDLMIAPIVAMRRKHPDVQFEIVEELEDSLLNSLKRGDVDIAISPEVYLDSDVSLATQATLSDLVSVHARTSHPFHTRDDLTLADLARGHWALPPEETTISREWRKLFILNDVEPPRACIVSRSFQVLRTAVLADDILCWAPPTMMRAEIGAGQIAALPLMDWKRRFRVYRRRKSHMTPATSALIHFVHQSAERSAAMYS